jgi:hypothetical protein
MKNLSLSFCFALFVLFANAQYTNENLCLDTEWPTVQKLTYKSLRIYPVKANDYFRNAFKDMGKYSNLKNAVENNKLVVSEVSEGGQVNTVYAENVSSDTVFIMAGEIIKGGKQDRVLAQNMIIPPSEKADLSAFCVERGRWSNGGKGVGQFSKVGSVACMAVKSAAVKDKDQSYVWENVSKVTEKNDAKSNTGTYNELDNSDSFQKKLDEYMPHFKNAFANKTDVIGVIAVTGSKVISCDLFATHHLFVSSYESLLHAYVTESITNGSEVRISDDEAQKYLTDFLANQKEVEQNGLKFRGKVVYAPRF